MRGLAVVFLLGSATLVFGGAAIGCKACGSDNGAGGAPGASASSEPKGGPSASAAPSAAAPRGFRGHVGGQYSAFFAAVRGMEITEDQKAKLEAIAKPNRDDDAREANKALQTELAAAIKAGKVERAKLEPHFAALEKAAKERHDKEAEALDGLYATLEPSQRTAVATTVRERMSKLDVRVDGPDAGAAHADGGKSDRDEVMTRHRVQRYKQDLDLDEAQTKKLEALLAKEPKVELPSPQETRKRNEAVAAAFEKPGFDAKKADPFDGKRARQAVEREALLLVDLVPLLTAAQREKLAATTERRAHGGNHGRRFERKNDERRGPAAAGAGADEPEAQ